MGRNLATNKFLTLEGVPELRAKVELILSKTVGQSIKRVYMGAALVLRDEARDLAPVGPDRLVKGRLIRGGAVKRSIFAAYGDAGKDNVLVGVNYKIAPHAWLVEFGTSKWRGKPYMRPAIRAVRAKAANIIADGFRKLLEEAAR